MMAAYFAPLKGVILTAFERSMKIWPIGALLKKVLVAPVRSGLV